MLIGVALFLKFGCHGCNYIDGMLTGRAVAHKWFCDRKNAFEIRYRQLQILWRLRDNVKSHGQLALLSCYSFHKSNNWTAEDTAETSTKLKALGQWKWKFQFQRLIICLAQILHSQTRAEDKNKAWVYRLYLFYYAVTLFRKMII